MGKKLVLIPDSKITFREDYTDVTGEFIPAGRYRVRKVSANGKAAQLYPVKLNGAHPHWYTIKI